MCKVYNQIGCLTAIKSHLREHNLNEYRSVNELINFQKNYAIVRQSIISDHHFLIEEEKNVLIDEISRLNDSIKRGKAEVEQHLLQELDVLKHKLDDLSSVHTNILQTVFIYFKKIGLKKKIISNEIAFDFKVEKSIEYLTKDYDKKNSRHQFIVSNFEVALMESCSPKLQEHDRRKRVIDQVNSEIYGALGEQKVVKELEKLPDECILINDFNCRFYPAIYNRRENDYIRSIQIDHVLVSPSGIFLIETKNWSQDSLNNLSLRSPVQQIKRTNFALYRMLNGEISNAKLTIGSHHWGDRKIPIKNLIVLINHKPIEEFQHVKILTLNELLRYINYFKPCFSTQETQVIANYLINFTGR